MKPKLISVLTKVGDRFLKDMSLEEVVRHLQEATFFMFMESGRHGIKHAAHGVLLTAWDWYDQRGFQGESFGVVRNDMLTRLEMNLVNQLVRKGMDGVYEVIYQNVLAVANVAKVKQIDVIYKTT